MHKYTFTTASGEVCCSMGTIDHLCEHCRAAADAADKMAEDFDGTAPNSYSREALAALRTATVTPESTFEERFKAQRLASLMEGHS